MDHGVLITADNPSLAELKLSWNTPAIADTDGLGPMRSLYEAGDALVAVARFEDEGFTILGSGVMVGPGLLVTATHVLDEFPREGPGPVLLTFLPKGARAWLPIDIRTVSGQSMIDGRRKVVSDVSLVSCTLNSQAHIELPLMLAPIQVCLPLIGERLWAYGFRHQAFEDGAAFVTPLVSSGQVTAAYPHGRGERMPSPCIEVDMDTVGGMSGGAVVNAAGNLVGILSSSFEGGPSYITLIWDALRLRVNGSTPRLRASTTISLLGARALGLVKLAGNVHRNPWGDITLRLPAGESDLLVRSAPAGALKAKLGFDSEEQEQFLDDWGAELENMASEATIEVLSRMPPSRAREFLEAAGVPEGCLQAIEGFSVEDFGGVEDFELLSTEVREDGRVGMEFYFELQTLVWTVTVPLDAYHRFAEEFRVHFDDMSEDGDLVRLDLFQRCYFRGETTFDRAEELFSDLSITSCAIRRQRKPQLPAGPAT